MVRRAPTSRERRRRNLGPGPALDGALAEAGLGELAYAGGCGDLDLVAVVVELVLDHLLYTVLIGADYLTRRQEEVEVLSVVLLQLPPSDFARWF